MKATFLSFSALFIIGITGSSSANAGTRDSGWMTEPTLHGDRLVFVSEGDIFPYMFREMGLGPLIGMRTWGGVVGIRSDKGAVDGGMTTQPEYATWTLKDGWDIENYGVDPDIEVDNTPHDHVEGRDRQLERAIEELERRIREMPVEIPSPPAYPE